MTFPAIEHVAFLLVMATGLLFSVFGVGELISQLCRLESRIERSVVFGLFIFIVPSWYISRFGDSPLLYMRIVLIIGIVSATFILINLTFTKKAEGLSNFGMMIIATGVTVFSLWRPIRELASRGIHDGIFTLGNNDVANYALDVKAILDSGFAASKIIENVSYGLHALGDYSGAMLYLSVPSSLFGDSSVDLLIASLISVNSIVWLSLAKVASVILRARTFSLTSMSIATAGVLLPMHQYVVGNFFLAQLLSMGITFFAVGLILERLSRPAEKGIVVELAILSALNIFVYPPIGLPMFFATWLFILGQDFVSTTSNLKSSLTFFGLTIVIIGMQWKWALALFADRTIVIAGWALSNISLGSAVIWVDQMDIPGSAILTQGSWLLLIFVYFFLLVKSKRDVDRKLWTMVLVIGTAVILAISLVTAKYGYGYFQMWKALTYLLPLFMVITLSLLVAVKSLDSIKHLFIGLLIGAGVASTSSLWGPTINAANQGSELISNPDLTLLSSNPELRTLSSINVQLRPYLETMLASAIVPIDIVSMASNTYYEARVLLDTCTLKRRDELLPSDPVEFEVNSSYVVVSLPTSCAR